MRVRELALSEAATHGEQGCRPQERGAAQCHSPRPGELAARRSRGQLDGYQRLPGNYCDGCAKDTARAGAPQSRGARDAGLHRGLSDQQRLEQATGGRDLLSRKCSEEQPCGHAAGARRHRCRAATEGGPKGDPGSSRRSPSTGPAAQPPRREEPADSECAELRKGLRPAAHRDAPPADGTRCHTLPGVSTRHSAGARARPQTGHPRVHASPWVCVTHFSLTWYPPLLPCTIEMTEAPTPPRRAVPGIACGEQTPPHVPGTQLAHRVAAAGPRRAPVG